MTQNSMNYFKALYKVARTVNSSLEPAQVLQDIAEAVTSAMDAKASAIRVLDPRRQELKLGAAHGLSEGYVRKGKVLVEKSGLDRQALEGGPVCMLDAQTDPGFQYQDRAKEEGIRSICVVPMKIGDRAIGVLRVYSADERQWSEDEIQFLEAVANLSAIALDNARLHQALKNDYDLLLAHQDRLDDN